MFSQDMTDEISVLKFVYIINAKNPEDPLLEYVYSDFWVEELELRFGKIFLVTWCWNLHIFPALNIYFGLCSSLCRKWAERLQRGQVISNFIHRSMPLENFKEVFYSTLLWPWCCTVSDGNRVLYHRFVNQIANSQIRN
ncbi:hypothetical protein HS088_TW04G00720 [Tripterygium wilfordii]|uniref:Uncharacterized protein n=1 Tax=Tripterygium wilfordii TaxID=458696 RepID=A0A7J7DQT9_TRIWF|nr:hypothetical protein HS088_TW04G00720 [Tripterygium wilfordii]